MLSRLQKNRQQKLKLKFPLSFTRDGLRITEPQKAKQMADLKALQKHYMDNIKVVKMLQGKFTSLKEVLSISSANISR